MGLSSKQVSSSGFDNWNKALLQPPPAMRKQQQNQPSEPLKCPRCDSTNTKFCYYNNYNKSQPRHFCRTCKRHWTKGGTLRNVPVGGGRKNKRMKKSTASTSSSATATATTSSAAAVTTSIGNLDGGVNIHAANIQSPQQIKKNLPLAVTDQKNVASLFQSVIRPSSLMPQQNLVNTREMETKDFSTGNGIFLSSSFSLAQNQGFHFPFSTSSSFETNPSSVSASLRSSSGVYNYVEEFKPLMEEVAMNSALLPSTSGSNTQPWEVPPPPAAAAATSGAMDMSSYWNWEDIDSLVSTDHQNLSWPEDSDIKP